MKSYSIRTTIGDKRINLGDLQIMPAQGGMGTAQMMGGQQYGAPAGGPYY